MRAEIFADILHYLLIIQIHDGSDELSGLSGENGNAYFARVRAQLEALSGVISALLIILGIDRYDWTVKVFLVPKNPEIGEYRGEGIVYWGHREVFPGYHTIGIIHESLHCLLEGVHNASDEAGKWRLHALIVLIADVYMRSMIDPSGGFRIPKKADGYNQKLITEVREWAPVFCRAFGLGNTDLAYLLRAFGLSDNELIDKPQKASVQAAVVISTC